MSDAQIIETCELAITHLTEVGWTRKQYLAAPDSWTLRPLYPRRLKACAVGAMVIVGFPVDQDLGIEWPKEIKQCPAVEAVRTVILERYPHLQTDGSLEACSDQAIVRFNDDIAESVDDVIEILQETIKRHQDAISEDEDF